MRTIATILLAMAFSLASCQSKNDKDYLVTIHTSYGDMEIVLFDETPQHKENFIKLAKNGQYDSTIFHRVINTFMIQGGDINAKKNNHDKVEYTIPAEFVTKYFHRKGALAAARMGDNVNPQKESSGCQFYIVQGTKYSKEELTLDNDKIRYYLSELYNVPGYENLANALDSLYMAGGSAAITQKINELRPIMEERFNVKLTRDYPEERAIAYSTVGGTPHLDDAYTVFGQVVKGLEVVDKIAAVKTQPGDKPIEDVYMTMDVKEISKNKAKKLYLDAISKE